ncbi:hypothetical protein WA158_000655 [Blastocystis sp. Blastoise]
MSSVELTTIKKEEVPVAPQNSSSLSDEHSCECTPSDAVAHSDMIDHVVQHENHFDVVIHDELHHIDGDHFVSHGRFNPTKNPLLNMNSFVGYLEQIGYCYEHFEYSDSDTNVRRNNITDNDLEKYQAETKKVEKRSKNDRCIIVGALALQADAFHMASDLIALIVGYSALSVSKRKRTERQTYGMDRYETIGAIINSVFLMSVCFNIVIEALTRMIDIQEVKDGMEGGNIDLYLYVAVIGLLINVVGIFIFGCSGEDEEGGHTHAHAHAHHHHHEEEEEEEECDHDHEHNHDEHEHNHDEHEHNHDEHEHNHDEHNHEHEHNHDEHEHEHNDEVAIDKNKCMYILSPSPASITHKYTNVSLLIYSIKKKKRSQNIQAVFLHVAGDALGSVAAIVSACIIKYCSGDWKYYSDPVCSLVIVVLILIGAIPLLMSVLEVLMQTAPESVNMKKLRAALLAVPGVTSVHELHVWQLTPEKIVCSLHVKVSDVKYNVIQDELKKILHKNGIHSSTIQIEHYNHQQITEDKCTDIICNNKKCVTNSCCH